MLDQNLEMEQVEKNRSPPNENVRKTGRVDLAQISWEKAILRNCEYQGTACQRASHTYLGNELALLKLAINHDYITILVHFRASQSGVERGLGSRGSSGENGRLLMRAEVLILRVKLGRHTPNYR
jgi:hypothetical protein